MNILMFVGHYPYPVVGGLERQAHELSKVLAARGHEITVLSTRFNSSQLYAEVIDGVTVYRSVWFASARLRFLVLPFSLAAMLVRLRPQVDVIHVHNISWIGAFVSWVARTLGLPVLTKLPNVGEWGIPGMRRQRFGFLRIGLLKQSSAIVAMTLDSVNELAGVSYPTSQILRVTNGIPITNFSIERPMRKTVNVVYVGRLTPQKGLPDLLHAWAACRQRISLPARLILVGDGPQLGILQDMSVSLGISTMVDFVGHHDDVSEYLMHADVFVLPSYTEGNSNAILEAMRAGLPVISTRIGGAAIQVGPSGQPLLYEPGDEEALASRLVALIENPGLRCGLGQIMRQRVENLFAMERIAAIYEEAYRLLALGQQDAVGLINPGLFDDTAKPQRERNELCAV